MEKSYNIIANITISHTYFKNKKFKFGIRPCPNTNRFLKSHRIIFKPYENSFKLIQEGFKKNGEFLPKISFSEENLFFEINFNDKLFQTKTEIPLYKSKNQKLIFLLDHNIYKVADVLLGSFTIENSSSISNNILKYNGNQLDFILDGDLRKYSTINDQLIEIGSKLVFWSNHKYNCDSVLNFKVNQSKLLQKNITLKSRFIYWRYLIKFNYKNIDENYEIIFEGDDKELDFEKKINLSDKTIEFTSLEKVQLKNQFNFKLSLVHNRHNIIISSLPFPELKNFQVNSKKEYLLIAFINI